VRSEAKAASVAAVKDRGRWREHTGAEGSPPPRLVSSNRSTDHAEPVDVLPLEAPADAVSGALGTRLERMGQPIGGNDLLIAAQTVALGQTLVTDNEREFTRIAELPVGNWLR
jgi:predicted nucleic acid-binding protein